MEGDKAVQKLIGDVFSFAEEKHLEWVTPEVLLLELLNEEDFSEAIEQCGGDIRELQRELLEYTDTHIDRTEDAAPEFSAGAQYMFSYAAASAASAGRKVLGVPHLIRGLWQLEDSYALYFLKKQEIGEAELLRELIGFEEEGGAGERPRESSGEKEAAEKSASQAWGDTYVCLNDIADSANPLIGREEELERAIQVLCRKEKNNPLFIGEPGVGKTALVYGLAQRINAGKVPPPLAESRVFELDLGSMVAGTQFRGDFEKKFKTVLKKLGEEKQPIIFIDEIHNLSGAGAVGEGSLDASNMLKPYLQDDHIRFIGATTYEEYKKHFERSRGVIRRFQNIDVREPSEEECRLILKGLQETYERYHGVKYEEGVPEYAVSMSAKHINERFLPDKAIDLMDEAGAFRKLHPLAEGPQLVDKEVVAHTLTKICRVPVESVQTDEDDGLATLDERLKSRVFGQDEAIVHVVNAIKFSRAGLLEEDKPLASLLFVGPTGVGKTEVAKSLSEELGIRLIRFDMSEYEEKHAVAKLIGAPAGYVGYEEGGLLTESIRKTPHCVLLLDEIEKAHADIYNVLLSIMDYATLTDNQGRKADFRNVILIMTSNAGAKRIGKQSIGFTRSSLDSGVIMEEVKNTFQPEFRNRLNRIIVFHGMDEDMANRIIRKKLSELEGALEKRSIRFRYDDETCRLIRKRGISTEYGAREIDRVIRNEIKPLFVDEILFGRLKKGGTLLLTAEDEGFVIRIGDGQSEGSL